MKQNFLKRVMVLAVTFCLLLTMIPLNFSVNDVEAVSGVNNLTCANFISNSTARSYIDTMMRYYINNNSSLRTTLDNGLSVVFMFEGGSDNYWNGSVYENNAYDTRNQAVCIVVKKNSAGNAYIDYYCENSSSIPGEPTWCTGAAYSGSTTLMDGVYSFYTTNHTGPYAALQVNLSASNGNCYYTPPGSLNGYQNGASGINIHTRSSNIAGGSSLGWVWSAGCQVIGTGNGTSNEFNAFMQSVCNITWNPWVNYSSKVFNSWASSNMWINKGYYVVDRQLGLKNPSGTKYGSGSLINLYNSTALTNITAKSTAAMKAAGADKVDYVSQCTYYPAYCTIKVKENSSWSRALPCYPEVDSTSAAISTYNAGETLTATGLYKNTKGEYWYRTINKAGGTSYMYANLVDYVKNDLSDIKMTNHTPPNGHVKGSSYIVSGDIASQYNQLTNVAANVYQGIGTSGTKVTGSSASFTGTSYKLANSTVDANVLMGILETGAHTLVITASYKNYYVSGLTLKSNTGTRTLATDYFIVIPSSVTQSSCNHTYQNYVIKAATCTANGESLKACSTCGYVSGKTTVTGGHSYGDWVITNATCVKEGSKVRTCSKCGNKETEVIPFGGHSYSTKTIDATCKDYERVQYTCSNCGDVYSEYADALANWSETKPAEEYGRTIESKTEYRYSDYSSTTSYNASVDGYTVEKTEWEKNQTGNVKYVKSWPSGFNTSNSLYSTYNKTPKTAVTNTNDKTVIDSDKVVGYLYYHWCYADSYYSADTKKDNYTTFHAYYSTTAPSTYQCDASDMSYCTKDSCCSNSEWFFAVEVYQQKYTTYKKLYTHSKWSDWSQWSDTEPTASSTRKVESRTLYRSIKPADLGSHIYVDGFCTECNKAQPDFYLFGYINGADYACEGDADNIGIYKFTDGKLTAEFTENSYVAFKTSDNQEWFMADGYPGDGVSSAVFYNTNKGINAEKLFVPKGVEVDFTLVDNGDGSFTLSYDLGKCEHKNHNTNGFCTVCGAEVEHNFGNGVCTGCGKAAPVYYLTGFINGEDYTGSDYRFVDGTLTTEFSSDSYVCVRNADNSVWYMTDGYQEGAVCAILYDANTLEGRGDKLFVPKGQSIAFTLVENEDGTFILSFTTNICKHTKHNTDGQCLACGERVEHSFSQGFCTVCGRECVHNYGDENICTICQKVKPALCLFGFINGEDYNGTEYKFINGKLTVKFTEATYVAVKTDDDQNWYMTDTYQGDNATSATLYNTKILEGRGDKLYIPRGREITFTLVDNGDDTYTLSYVAAECQHDMHNVNGVCLSCGKTVEHTIVNGDCIVCGNNCKHIWENGICTKCQRPEPSYYLVGFINGSDYDGSDYVFDGGKLVFKSSTDAYIALKTDDMVMYMTDGYLGENTTSATFYNSAVLGNRADKLFIPMNREVVISLVDNGNNTVTLSYQILPCKHETHDENGICPDCLQSASHSFEDGFCYICGYECVHTYANGVCSACNAKEPPYYLFGYINGRNYACDEDFETIGVYKFINGKLTVVFTKDSFVAVKSGDNLNWFMTDGYQENAVSVTLYNTNVGINADKLFVPKGRAVTFTLTKNDDGTLTLSYVAAPCEHLSHNTNGECLTCGENSGHKFNQGVCCICSLVCEHTWVDDTCSVCQLKCEHNWIEGKCYSCGQTCSHSYADGVCTVCGFECAHKFVDGYCNLCKLSCEHNWINGKCFTCKMVCTHDFEDAVCKTCAYICRHNYKNGECLICGTVCGHKWSHGECIVCDVVCSHTWINGTCNVCFEVCEHTWLEGACTECNVSCEHAWNNGVCSVCDVKCDHTWKNSVCKVCSMSCVHKYQGNTCEICSKTTDFYLVGDINNSTVGYGADYKNKGNNLFVNGTLTMTFTEDSYVLVKSSDNKDWYMAKDKKNSGRTSYLYNTKTGAVSEFMYIPAGVKVTFTLTPLKDDSLKLSYEVLSCQHTTHDTMGKCIGCRVDVEHNFTEGYCSVCSLKAPGDAMYLFGTINGADYGYNSDAAAIGDYKFDNGRITTTFTEDSYVAVKSYDNKKWFMGDGNTTADGTSAVMYNTREGKGYELLYVPGGKEVSFKLTENADGTYTLSYTVISDNESRIVPKYTSLSLEDGIRYQVFFSTENMSGITTDDMGLMIFLGDGTKFTATEMLWGAVNKDGYFMVQTNAIHSKAMGDTVYFRVYAKLSDGTYIYSDLLSFSAESYAYSVLNSKYSTKEEKALMVALLNYGASAQNYFEYNTDKLVNANLTAQQKALVKDYSADMADKLVPVDGNKQGEFVKQGTGFMLYPTANFSDTMFTVVYNMKTKLPITGEVKLYYWTADAYNSVSSLTKNNATGVLTMSMTDTGDYAQEISNIGIQSLDDTIYAAVVFESGDNTYCSGVVAYSMAEYCKVAAENNLSSVQDLAQATIVYGYYMDKYCEKR